MPGAVAPASTCPGVSMRARYQMAGMPNARCGSPASNGAPVRCGGRPRPFVAGSLRQGERGGENGRIASSFTAVSAGAVGGGRGSELASGCPDRWPGARTHRRPWPEGGGAAGRRAPAQSASCPTGYKAGRGSCPRAGCRPAPMVGAPEARGTSRPAKRPRAGDPGIHAAGIGIERRAGVGRQGGADRPRRCARTPNIRINRSIGRWRAEQLEEFAGGGAAGDVHLEHPLARMQEAQAAAASSSLAAWMRGMPSASRVMSTGADSPGMAARRSPPGAPATARRRRPMPPAALPIAPRRPGGGRCAALAASRSASPLRHAAQDRAAPCPGRRGGPEEEYVVAPWRPGVADTVRLDLAPRA